MIAIQKALQMRGFLCIMGAKRERRQMGVGKRTKKELKDLTIVDDFMFGAVMSNPKLCKPLLEMILETKIRKIEYPELQKTIDKQYGSKGVRLDVYVEDEENTVYNIEIQTSKKKYLPKRTRYYQGMIDLNIIDSGDEYAKLKKSYVIFICTYDPFGEGRYIYTFENRCLQNLDLALGDEATKIILNTKGTIGEISDELKAALKYMDGCEPESEYAKNLKDEVEDVRVSERWRREFMTLLMRDKENRKAGRYENAVSFVREFYGDVDDSRIMSSAKISQEIFDAILSCIADHPDWDDEDVADWLIDEFD